MAGVLVGGAFLSGFINVVLDRLISTESVKFVVGKKLDRKLVERLQTALLAAEALVADAEQKQLGNEFVRKWLDSLRDAVYTADDLLDTLLIKAATHQKKVDTFWDRFLNFEDSETMNKIEEVVRRIEDLGKLKDSLCLEKIPTDSSSWWTPSSSLVRGNVYGREDDKKALIKMLNDNNEHHLSVISIVGIGGVGKTTLAQWLYNNEDLMKGFEMKAWVCVSQDFDIVDTTKNVLKGILGGSCSSLDDFNSLQLALKEKLSNKKFFIVLDDVWSYDGDRWSNFITPFRYGDKGSTIFLTTREKNVASVVQNCQPYFLNKLSKDSCWSVLADNASFPQSNGSSALDEIGKKIVEKCDGLPLAAETLGRLLRTKHDAEKWNKILRSDIWEIPKKDSNIIPALLISYYHLPAYLKRCFVYCSMFPKGHLFEKDELILLWMAEDLLRPPKKGETLEEVGSECFDELASRMFFTQYFQDGENYFVMHDLLLDLAVFLAGDFYFRLEELGEEEEEISIRTRHLCGILHHCSSKLFNSISKVESLRTLLYNKFSSPPFNIEAATCEVLSKCKFLRVLSLHKLDVLPDSIRELIHLRYLDLSFSNIKTLPESFCNLHNLQTLKLYYCSKLIMLPSGMHNLVELRHLDLRGTSLKEMPREISKLKHLQILRNFVVGKNKDSNGLEELGGLSNLHGLFWIEKLENIVDVEESRSARIIDKTHIEELCLEWSSGDDDMVSNTQTERDILDSLQPHNGLKELRIKGYKGTIFPNWVGSCSFYNMTSVYLASCNNCCMLPSLGELPSLQSLHIEGFGQLKTIGMEFYKNEDSHQSSSLEPFPSLQNLEFHDMPCWEEWELAGNRLPTYLEVLSIRHCRKLEFLKRQMIKYGLVELRIHDSCDSLTSFSVDDFPCLKVLDISMCSNLESVSISDPPHVALRRLSIHSCPEFVSFPGDILAAPNLIHFSVIMCSKFEALPCFMESLLPNLEYLFVQGCPGICRLPEGGLPPILKELRVGGCEEQLKALSSMGNMDTLTSLTILGSSEVRSYRELHSLPRLPSLTTLHLWGFHDLEELDCDKLLRLSSLQCLQISYCEKLENISGEKLPSSLLLLQIQDCPLLEQHCNNKNQEIWSKISHIPTIQVNYKQIF